MIIAIIGFVAGIISGIAGLGGAAVIIPALVVFLGFNQHLAQGTTMAMMVPPIGILAAYVYYKNGHVDVKVAGIMAICFIVGGFLGAKIAVNLPVEILRKSFAILLVGLGIKMFFKGG